MIEGKLWYDEQKDCWYLIMEDNRKIDVSNFIYEFSDLNSFFDEESLVGEGEYFKVELTTSM